jgi:hypothetical protein
MAFGGHALAGARLSLGSRMWLDLDARGELLGVRIKDELAATWSAGAGAGVGFSF